MHMADFYTLLARYYDTIFPAEQEIVDFLADELARAPADREAGIAAAATAATAAGAAAAPGPQIIDAACGTGNYTDALAGRGFDCLGFDSSSAMIEVARRSGKRGRFEVQDLQDLGGRASQKPQPRGEGSVDGLFCIGNSLPHLPSREAVRRFFVDAARVVAPGGTLIVQTVNFARFTAAGGAGEAELPSVERPEVTMHRSYRQSGEEGTVLFHMELRTADGERAAGDTPLLALSRDELLSAAGDAGFTDLALYGSYERGEYRPDASFLMILSARQGDDSFDFR